MKTITRGRQSAPERELPSISPQLQATKPDEGETSPLAVARTRRKLTVEQLAERAGLTAGAVEALEQGRLYRFPSQRDAVAAVVLYSCAIGISESEARELAGLAPRQALIGARRPVRLVAALAFVGAAVLLAWFVIVPRFSGDTTAAEAEAQVLFPPPEIEASLPAAWEIRVDVLNGSSTGRAAARLADKVAGLSYQIGEVANAPRRDYPKTRVYYTPGSAGIAERLAEELGVDTQELPGGDEPRRLVVIAGAEAPLD